MILLKFGCLSCFPTILLSPSSFRSRDVPPTLVSAHAQTPSLPYEGDIRRLSVGSKKQIYGNFDVLRARRILCLLWWLENGGENYRIQNSEESEDLYDDFESLVTKVKSQLT